jgi:hypothetical protein
LPAGIDLTFRSRLAGKDGVRSRDRFVHGHRWNLKDSVARYL